jgi:hypothetical protein
MHSSRRGVFSLYLLNILVAFWYANHPYAEVTMAEVLDWIWANGVDKDATEESLAAQIEAQKNPVTAAGVPW